MTLKSLTVSSGFVPTRSGGPLIVFSVLGSFDGTWFFRWNLVISMEVGFSDGSCLSGIFFGGGGHPSSSEFWVLPVSLGPMEAHRC